MTDRIAAQLAARMARSGVDRIRCVATRRSVDGRAMIMLTGVRAMPDPVLVTVKVMLRDAGTIGIADLEIAEGDVARAGVGARLTWRKPDYAAPDAAAA